MVSKRTVKVRINENIASIPRTPTNNFTIFVDLIIIYMKFTKLNSFTKITAF